MKGGRRPRTAPKILERVPKNPPAHGAWNGRRGVVGTGEALLGPGSAAREAGPPITTHGKWRAAERESEGAVVVKTAGTTQPGPSEGPLLHRRTGEQGGDR